MKTKSRKKKEKKNSLIGRHQRNEEENVPCCFCFLFVGVVFYSAHFFLALPSFSRAQTKKSSLFCLDLSLLLEVFSSIISFFFFLFVAVIRRRVFYRYFVEGKRNDRIEDLREACLSHSLSDRFVRVFFMCDLDDGKSDKILSGDDLYARSRHKR